MSRETATRRYSQLCKNPLPEPPPKHPLKWTRNARIRAEDLWCPPHFSPLRCPAGPIRGAERAFRKGGAGPESTAASRAAAREARRRTPPAGRGGFSLALGRHFALIKPTYRYRGEMKMRLKKYCIERFEKVVEPPWWPPIWIWNGIFCNRGKTFFLRWYQRISDFNESPVRALSWLLILIAAFSLFFWLLLSDSGKSFHYALTSAIPLFDFPADSNSETAAPLGWKGMGLHYSEVFLSTIVWTLLILSVRQKFRR